ncbi:MAG TPA: MarR family transcriptional regulator [Opitutaceae bacterium]
MQTPLRVLLTAQALEKASARLFAPHGLTPAQFNVLNLLSDRMDGMRASDLAKELIVDPSNVTGLLKRMKAKGWLAELDNGADRRQRIVGLTAKGRARWTKAHADYAVALEKIEETMNERERAVVEKVLQRFVEQAERT